MLLSEVPAADSCRSRDWRTRRRYVRLDFQAGISWVKISHRPHTAKTVIRATVAQLPRSRDRMAMTTPIRIEMLPQEDSFFSWKLPPFLKMSEKQKRGAAPKSRTSSETFGTAPLHLCRSVTPAGPPAHRPPSQRGRRVRTAVRRIRVCSGRPGCNPSRPV